MKKDISNKSIVIAFRIKPYHLAKAIDGLKTYDKAFFPDSVGQIGKACMMHGINYLCHALPIEPSPTALAHVIDLIENRTPRKKYDMNKILSSPIKFDKTTGEKTESVKSNVTDFSPIDINEINDEEQD